MAISRKVATKFAENCVPQSLNLSFFQFAHHASAAVTPVVALRVRRFQIAGIFALNNNVARFERAPLRDLLGIFY